MQRMSIRKIDCGFKETSIMMAPNYLYIVIALLFLLLLPSLGQAKKKSPQDVIRELDAALVEYDKKISEFTTKRNQAQAKAQECSKNISNCDKRQQEIIRERASIEKAWPNRPSKWAHLTKEYNKLSEDRKIYVKNASLYSHQRDHYDSALKILWQKRREIQAERNRWASFVR